VIEVLRGVDLDVQPGEIVALLGPSGSGKSTLLQAVGLLEGGFEGSIRIAGKEASQLPRAGAPRSAATARLRLPVPPPAARLQRARECRAAADDPRRHPRRCQCARRALLTALGLGQRLTHRPSQLSGGEQQRVAVARALANRPALVLADEPTGNLDEATADKVLEEFLNLVRGEGRRRWSRRITSGSPRGWTGWCGCTRAGWSECLDRDADACRPPRHAAALGATDRDAIVEAFRGLELFTTTVPEATIDRWYDRIEGNEQAAGRVLPFTVLDAEGRDFRRHPLHADEPAASPRRDRRHRLCAAGPAHRPQHRGQAADARPCLRGAGLQLRPDPHRFPQPPRAARSSGSARGWTACCAGT
jgi:lipoprotein-releasing system ATP-binding protein